MARRVDVADHTLEVAQPLGVGVVVFGMRRGERRRRVAHEGGAAHDGLKASSNVIVFLAWKPTADEDLPVGVRGDVADLGEEAVRVEEGLMSGAFEGSAGTMLLGSIALEAVSAREDRLMDDGVVVGEEEHGGADVAAELGVLGDGVGEEGPEVGDGEAGGDGGEAVGRELVGRVGGLAGGLGELDADFLDLQFVADDEDTGDGGEDA